MPTFKDLSDKERIQSIKDTLVLLLENLVSVQSQKIEPAELDRIRAERLAQYIKVEKPNITETTSTAEKEKLEANYQLQQQSFEKVMNYLRSVKKTKGCVCNQGCYEIDATNKVLPPEFEPLLVAARKIAENRIY
jgi:hypothetical protein